MSSSPIPAFRPEPRRGREARRAARAQRGVASIPYITRAIPTTEILGEEGLALIERNAETLLQEIGIEFRDPRERAGALQGRRLRRQGRARPLSPRPRAKTLRDGAGELRAARPQPRAQCRHRRPVDGFRAQLRSPSSTISTRAVATARSRTSRTSSSSPISRLYPPFRRNGLRAGRSARQQAALRNGLRAHALVRQTLHGVGDQAGARGGHGRDVRNPVRQGLRRREHRLHQSHQRNSPLVWDSTMLGAAEAYARANQACVITPFILSAP